MCLFGLQHYPDMEISPMIAVMIVIGLLNSVMAITNAIEGYVFLTTLNTVAAACTYYSAYLLNGERP